MGMLFHRPLPLDSTVPPICYEGRCPRTGDWLQLFCTTAAQAAARDLMAELAQSPEYNREGKMYGVLLVRMATGSPLTLKAFSGLLQGSPDREGWVPPIPGRDQVALAEAQTLAELADLTAEIRALQHLPDRQAYAEIQQQHRQEWQALKALQEQRRQARSQQRQILRETLHGTALSAALGELDRQSQGEGREQRQMKAAHQQTIAPFKACCDQADDRILTLKRRRKTLSRTLQAQMHSVYRLQNFAGESIVLQDVLSQGFPVGLPTGTGDCAAPKLLHYAASQGWHPLGLAEFWWGPAQGDKSPGQFYGPCRDRCQRIMGFLLSGLSDLSRGADSQESKTFYPVTTPTTTLDIPIVYADGDLLVVDKPAGLLSVPGRTSDRQDSVLSRLRCQYPDGDHLQTAHRLDQDTSGLLLIARHALAHRHLSQQFALGQVDKRYQAIVTRPLALGSGIINLPLWGDPQERPRQQVNREYGKPSMTQYRIMSTSQTQSRVEFCPQTGRTHQLRVHAAHPQGLNAPILGDRLYGRDSEKMELHTRLHLHACFVSFVHPSHGSRLDLCSVPGF